MIISLHFRERLSGVLQVVQDELDNIVAVIRAWSNVEHNDDGSHSPNVGNILEFLAGANIGAGQPVYISAGADQTAAGQAFLADATASAKSSQAAVVGLATQSTSAGGFVRTRDRGIFKGLAGLTAGRLYYVGTTPGSLTVTAPTNAVVIGLAISTEDMLLLLRNPTAVSSEAILTWTGPTSGSQNMQTGTTLNFATPGTYTITVSSALTLSIDAAAGGGGGGGDTSGSTAGSAGGGGGGVSRATSVSLVSGKTYTLIVGAGGAGSSGTGSAGGGASFVNTTDTFNHVVLGGGGGGQGPGGAGGTAGTATVGSGLVAGGTGGGGAGAGAAGNAGACNANGAGGGGSGAGRTTPGLAGGTGGGGTGSTPVGAPGGASGDGVSANAVGGQTATGATGGAAQADLFGGGGGGGGSSAVIGSLNAGGGGGGTGASGSGTPTLTGGNGANGVAVFTFVSAP